MTLHDIILIALFSLLGDGLNFFGIEPVWIMSMYSILCVNYVITNKLVSKIMYILVLRYLLIFSYTGGSHNFIIKLFIGTILLLIPLGLMIIKFPSNIKNIKNDKFNKEKLLVDRILSVYPPNDRDQYIARYNEELYLVFKQNDDYKCIKLSKDSIKDVMYYNLDNLQLKETIEYDPRGGGGGCDGYRYPLYEESIYYYNKEKT